MQKFIKDSVIQSMYRRLSKGMSGTDFVEMFYGLNFEQFLIEESSKNLEEYNTDLNHFLQPLHEIDINES